MKFLSLLGEREQYLHHLFFETLKMLCIDERALSFSGTKKVSKNYKQLKYYNLAIDLVIKKFDFPNRDSNPGLQGENLIS